MQSWGKILGLLFGFMFFKIPGALLGLFLGYLFDKNYAKALSESGGFSSLLKDKAPLASRAIFFHTLFSTMGHIAKSSGRVTEMDIALASALMKKMGLQGDLLNEAQAAYREGKQADFPITETIREFKQYCFGRKNFMLVYFEIQAQAAYANGQLHTQAEQILRDIAALLGIEAHTVDQILEQIEASVRFQQDKQSNQQNHSQQNQGQQNNQSDRFSRSKGNIKSAYKILGIQPTSDLKQVKKAYKRLMSQHHPDKLSAQGLPPQALTLAKEKTQEIQSAYECIMNKL